MIGSQDFPILKRQKLSDAMELVAIIDDDEDTLMILEAFLKEKWRISSHKSFKRAKKSFEKEPPDLILLDISIPGEDGKSILQEIRKISALKNIKVVAVTGHTSLEDRNALLKLGFDDFIAKPILEKKVFIEHINRLLS
jgi:DNA-binding response OmpR family regulator